MVDRYGNVFSASQVGVGWLDEAEKYSQLSVSNLIIENISINSQPVRDWNPYDETGAPRIVKHNQITLLSATRQSVLKTTAKYVIAINWKVWKMIGTHQQVFWKLDTLI